MPPINARHVIAHTLSDYSSYCEIFTKIYNLPRMYYFTKIDNLTWIVTGVHTKGDLTINNRNERFTIIVVCTSSVGIDSVEEIVARTVQ